MEHQGQYMHFFERMSVLLIKQRISVSVPPFWGLRGNVCDSSVACWKADGRLSIGYN